MISKNKIKKEISKEIKNFRVALVDLREHRYGMFYKDKLNQIEKKLNVLRVNIEKDVSFKGTPFWTIKDKLKNLIGLDNYPMKKEVLEGIEEDLVDLNKFAGNKKEEIKERFYDIGSQYDFYIDLKYQISIASKEIFIVDSYLHEDILNIYLEKASPNIKINILTNSRTPKGNFPKIARMFVKKHSAVFEVRECEECHDRVLFIDSSGWVMGQSIKDSAKNKPAYMIKLENPTGLEKIYRKLWNSATKVR